MRVLLLYGTRGKVGHVHPGHLVAVLALSLGKATARWLGHVNGSLCHVADDHMHNQPPHLQCVVCSMLPSIHWSSSNFAELGAIHPVMMCTLSTMLLEV
jgi:hypothetical protein